MNNLGIFERVFRKFISKILHGLLINCYLSLYEIIFHTINSYLNLNTYY